VNRRRLVLALGLAAVGCGYFGRKHYPLKGVVQAIRPGGEYVVAHEDIRGLMPAMSMPFRIRGASDVRPGDQIEASLVMTDKESWLEDVEVLARGLPVAKNASAVSAPLEPGAEVPAFPLVNQDGEAITLARYRGRTLVLTFIYTRCPVPEYCPRMMARFQKIDATLSADPVLWEKTHLLSISFDTAYDKPEVLRSYGRAFVKDRGEGRFRHWELATGSKEQIQAMADFFSLYFWGDDGQITHSLCTAVVGPDGRLVKVYRDNEWTAAAVVEDIKAAALEPTGGHS
jgi:protein SCO1/2